MFKEKHNMYTMTLCLIFYVQWGFKRNNISVTVTHKLTVLFVMKVTA